MNPGLSIDDDELSEWRMARQRVAAGARRVAALLAGSRVCCLLLLLPAADRLEQGVRTDARELELKFSPLGGWILKSAPAAVCFIGNGDSFDLLL